MQGWFSTPKLVKVIQRIIKEKLEKYKLTNFMHAIPTVGKFPR